MTKKDILLKICAPIAGAVILIAGGIAIGGAVKTASLQKKPLALPQGFTVTAHAGCLDTEPNTMDSLKAALGSGAQVVEVDIRFRPDGTPVIAHDKVKENSGGVLLGEVFAEVAKADGVQMNLDLKETKNLAQVQALAKEAGLLERVFFTGVDSKKVEKVKKDAPEIPYYLNAYPNALKTHSEEYWQKIADEVKEAGAVGLNCHYFYGSQQLVDVMHKNGLKVSVWTADKKSTMVRQISFGVDNITTREPIQLRRTIKDWNA